MMIKVVINDCYGGFGLSKVAIDMYCTSKGIAQGEWNSTWGFYDNFSCGDIPRDDPILVQIVEEIGDNANSGCAELKVVEVPDDADWYIEEYDGSEWVAERHRTWR